MVLEALSKVPLLKDLFDHQVCLGHIYTHHMCHNLRIMSLLNSWQRLQMQLKSCLTIRGIISSVKVELLVFPSGARQIFSNAYVCIGAEGNVFYIVKEGNVKVSATR